MKVNTLKSIGAIAAGFVISRLSIGVSNYIFAKTRIFSDYTHENISWIVSLFLILYYQFFMLLGSYLAAKLAPKQAMAHALTLGGIEFFIVMLTTIYYRTTTPTAYDIWPTVLTFILIFPGAWLGGKLNDWTTHSPTTTYVNSPYKNP